MFINAKCNACSEPTKSITGFLMVIKESMVVCMIAKIRNVLLINCIEFRNRRQ